MVLNTCKKTCHGFSTGTSFSFHGFHSMAIFYSDECQFHAASSNIYGESNHQKVKCLGCSCV